MRFVTLKLAAFLSFKEQTVIDFKQFGNQLILLFGGSGVGKTAIFDGITFALYGRGSGKDRCAGKVEDYHSDFAKEQDDKGNIVYHAPMLVELEFEHDGKAYTATRRINWGDGGKNKGFTYEMELKCEGVTVVNDTKRASSGSFAGNFTDNVSQRIIEMLGLNAEQFSQVVILAQGEFAKFLNANAQEREEILTKLVDNEDYVDFQLRLKEMNNYLKRIMDKIDEDIANALDSLTSRPTISQAEKDQYKSVDAQLLVALETNKKAREQEIDKLKSDIGKLEQEIGELNKQKGAADEYNNAYNKQTQQLAAAQADLAALRKSVDIAKGEAILEDLVKLQEILPKAEAYAAAVQELKLNDETIGKLQQKITSLEAEQADLAKAKAAVTEANTPEISALEGTIQKLEAAMKVYPVLAAENNKLTSLEKSLAKAEEALQTAEGTYNQAAKDKDAYEAELAELGNAVARKAELEAELKEAKQLVAELEKLQDALEDTNSKLEDYEEKLQLEKAAEETKNACLQAYDLAQKEYYLAEQKFQSGSIANKVREEAEKQQLKEIECPVCHTIHRVEALSQWESCVTLPEKQALEQADAKYKESVKELTKAEKNTSASKAIYETKLSNAMAKAQELLGADVTWEKLQLLDNTANPLAMEMAKRKLAKVSLQADFDAAAAKAQQQLNLQKKLKEKNDLLPSLKQSWDRSSEAKQAAGNAVNEQKNAVAKQIGMLAGCPATKAAAAFALDAAKTKKEELQAGINAAVDAFNRCVNAIASDKGQLQQAMQNHEPLVEKRDICAGEYSDVLVSCSWTEADFNQAHEERRDRNGNKLTGNNVAAVAKNTRKKLEDKKAEEAKFLHAIASLTAELKGKQPIDTSVLEATITVSTAKLKADNEAKDILQMDKEINEQTLVKVRASFKDRVKKQKVLRVIDPLANAANGSITFNRYVLEDLFCAMLDKANDRLNVLCSGQYELKPVEEGVAKKNKGLGFTVYDCINQSHRESGSNSGGEKFEISLSLALGLSDIVQSCSKKASRIESLFIDEGFGTLGKNELEKTKRLLLELSGGSRQIGIISHNPVLEEAIKNQIIVDRDKLTREGTKVSFALDC